MLKQIGGGSSWVAAHTKTEKKTQEKPQPLKITNKPDVNAQISENSDKYVHRLTKLEVDMAHVLSAKCSCKAHDGCLADLKNLQSEMHSLDAMREQQVIDLVEIGDDLRNHLLDAINKQNLLHDYTAHLERQVVHQKCELSDRKFNENAHAHLIANLDRRLLKMEARPQPKQWPILTALILLIVLMSAVLLKGCAREHELEAIDSPSLQAKAAFYTSLVPSVQDSHGFIASNECDSLLFTALVGAAGIPVDLTAARDSDGKWYRTPSKDCYPDHSASSISRDMLLGVMWYALAKRDLEIASSMYKYGEARGWKMGEGPASRTVLTPVFVATLAQLIYKLGGADYTIRHFPATWSSGQVDYEAHLQVLHILLRVNLYDRIESSAIERIKEQAKRQPLNPLFQYAYGNSKIAEELLLTSAAFPNGRLPTSKDRCEEWILQRDFGKDWKACPNEKHTYSGGDLIFLNWLMKNEKLSNMSSYIH